MYCLYIHGSSMFADGLRTRYHTLTVVSLVQTVAIVMFSPEYKVFFFYFSTFFFLFDHAYLHGKVCVWLIEMCYNSMSRGTVHLRKECGGGK